MSILSKTSKVDIVNQCLQSIGEPPISSLAYANSQDANMIINTIDEVTREVQSRGWSWNTDFNKVISKDINGIIALPTNTVRLDFKRLSDGTVPVLRNNQAYNPLTQSNIFSTDLTATKIVYFVDFESMPEVAKRYISVKSQRLWNTRILTDQLLSQITITDEQNAYMDLLMQEFTSNSIFEQEIVASGVLMEKFLQMPPVGKIQVLEQILQNLSNKRAYQATLTTDGSELTGITGIVNEVLSLIGSRSNFLGQVENELHHQILQRVKQVNIELQSDGYTFNRSLLKNVTPDVDGHIIITGNCLNVRKADPLENPITQYVPKVTWNGTSFQSKLFDTNTNSDVFTKTINLIATFLVDFDSIPMPFKRFLVTKVAMSFANQAAKNGVDPRYLQGEAQAAEAKWRAFQIINSQANNLKNNRFYQEISRDRRMLGGY